MKHFGHQSRWEEARIYPTIAEALADAEQRFNAGYAAALARRDKRDTELYGVKGGITT